jgi:predicted AAA+ superfamily ATPase
LANEFCEVIKLYSTIFNKSVEKVFIDEVQEMKDWEFLLLSLLNRGYEVFATGSSSKILKKEFSSLLRGKKYNLPLASV